MKEVEFYTAHKTDNKVVKILHKGYQKTYKDLTFNFYEDKDLMTDKNYWVCCEAKSGLAVSLTRYKKISEAIKDIPNLIELIEKTHSKKFNDVISLYVNKYGKLEDLPIVEGEI